MDRLGPTQMDPSTKRDGYCKMYSPKQINKTNETKEYHLKRLYELSLKSIGEIPQLDELTEEQKQWVKKHGF